MTAPRISAIIPGVMLTPESRDADFPSLRRMTYLNTAAEGIPPRVVVDALAEYGRDKLLGMDGREAHKRQRDALLASAGEMLGLSADEIGFCSCTSEAMNLLAMALRLGSDDEVIVSDLDFPATVTPWLHEGSGAKVKIWRARSDDLSLRVDDLIPLLGPNTRLVSVSLVSFLNGYRLPLREMIDAIRRHAGERTMIAVDVTQAIGRVTLAAEMRGVDFIVSSTHKWILGSHGGGIVGIPSNRADALTTSAGGWFNLRDAFAADRFEHPSVTLAGARGYSVGMPNYAAIYPVRAAMDYVRGVGIEAIDRHARPLVHACLGGLKKLPQIQVITPDADEHLSGIVAFRHPDFERIHRALHSKNIHVMAHAGRLRASIHGYNTAEDIERFLSVLRDIL